MKRRDRLSKRIANIKAEEKKPIVLAKENKDSFYYKYYKQLVIIPTIILIIAIVLIGAKLATTGDFMNKGISLKGGISVTALTNNIDANFMKTELLKQFPSADINVRTLDAGTQQLGLIVEADILPENNEVIDSFSDSVANIADVPVDTLSVETIGASLGDSFFKQTGVAVLVAFLFMGIVVFLYFKTVVPSSAVILAALSDIIVTLAIVNVLGIKIGSAGIAAFLMLIGYSVDTDILLSSRVLKDNQGTVYQRIIGAMKTGLTMSGTTIVAVVVTYIIAESVVLREILLIVLIGLFVDLVFTWFQNAGILRWYMEKKEGVSQ